MREMEGWLERLDEAARTGDWEAHIRAQWSLRDVCYRAAESSRLGRALNAQRNRAERYVRFLSRDLETMAEARSYLTQLIDACRAHDGEAAAASTYAAQYWALTQLGALLTTKSGGQA